MSRQKFPHRRPDGSFDVIVTLSGRTFDAERFANFIDQWVTGHASIVVNIPRAGIVDRRLGDEFFGPPTIRILDDGHAELSWRARPTCSRYWKDWLVQLLLDMEAGIPGPKMTRKITSRVD